MCGNYSEKDTPRPIPLNDLFAARKLIVKSMGEVIRDGRSPGHPVRVHIYGDIETSRQPWHTHREK
jgi:hypothetical protein